MLYLTQMKVRLPESMGPADTAMLQDQERAYSQDLQRRGVMRAIWRVVGKYANFAIFEVDDHDELHGILSGFPMFRYLEITVVPLARHPNALEYYLQG